MKDLLPKLEAEYTHELNTQIPLLQKKIDALRTRATEVMPDIRRAADGKAAGTITYADMKVLYLLVRHFKPKTIFEIGTWIGTSAMVMAEAIRQNGNGGMIYTCDTADCYLPEEPYQGSIRKITAMSDSALSELPADAPIDFIFADGEFTFKTIENLRDRLAPNALITTHDYVLPAEKGVINYLRLQLTSFGGYELLSSYTLSEQIHDQTVVGIMYRDADQNLLVRLHHRVGNLLGALIIGVRATLVRIYRKCTNYYEQ